MQTAMAAIQRAQKFIANKKRDPAPQYMIADKFWPLLRNIKLESQQSKKFRWQHTKL